MRGILIVFGILCASFARAQEDVDSAFDMMMGNSSQCMNTCEKTFSLHTYEKPSNLEACNRGCRLFSICQWVEDDNDFNHTLAACSEACDEAYSNGDDDKELSSCKMGCSASVKPAMDRQKMLDEEDPHIQLVVGDPFNSPSHLFFESLMMEHVDNFFSEVSKHPLMTATDDTMQNMMDYIMDFMNSDPFSLMMSMDDPDANEIIIISFNSPEINTQHPLERQLKHNTDLNDIHSKTTLDKVESNLQTNLYGHGREDIWLSDYYDDFDHYENPMVKDRFQEWWNCFTSKAGLPEIALLLFWVSTMTLLLMCCAMQFPSKKDSEKLSIYGDLAYIKESKGRVPEFLRVYGHPEVVRFTDVKKLRPDETIPIYKPQ